MSKDKKNCDRYNAPARVFHWAIALLIVCLLVVGFFMTGMDSAPRKFEIYGLHKSFGLTVLLLAVLRVAWKIYSSSPPSLSEHLQWEKVLSKTIHVVLYLAIFMFPLSGWLMSSAGGRSVQFFGVFDMPQIAPKDEGLQAFAKLAHEVLAYTVLVCVGLHVVGAFKHHVMDKDVTLTRMGGNLVFVILGLFLLGLAAFFAVQKWV